MEAAVKASGLKPVDSEAVAALATLKKDPEVAAAGGRRRQFWR
jgi:hypothetical protein